MFPPRSIHRLGFFCLIMIASAAMAQISFNKASYPVGTRPLGLITADFNHDGMLDLATANSGGHSVSILLGDRHGSFSASNDFAAGNTPEALAAGDVNHDGNIDLVVADGDGHVAILLGNGDGTFQAPYFYGSPSHPDSIALGDFNGDGFLDIAVPDMTGKAIAILWGRGDGTFSPGRPVSVAMTPNSVFTADFNRDGIADLGFAVCCSGDVSMGSVYVMLGNTGGILTPAKAHRPQRSLDRWRF